MTEIDPISREAAIVDRYEPLETLGRGALGSIHRVRDRQKGDLCRLVLATAASVDSRLLALQLEQARKLISFYHPRISPLRDVGNSNLGPFLVYQEARGWGLQELMAARRGIEGGGDLADGGVEPPEASLVVSLGLRAAQALAVVHELPASFLAVDPEGAEPAPARVTGRDGLAVGPAPSDFVVRSPAPGEESGLVLIDLGLIRSWQRRASLALTSTGGSGLGGASGGGSLVVGRLRYTAPELFEDGAEATPSSDLYALGLVLYELGTGRFPIVGTSASALLAGHLLHPPLSFEHSDPGQKLPPSLRQLVLQLLSKSPADRPSSTREVVERLAEISSILGEPGADALAVWAGRVDGKSPSAGQHQVGGAAEASGSGQGRDLGDTRTPGPSGDSSVSEETAKTLILGAGMPVLETTRLTPDDLRAALAAAPPRALTSEGKEPAGGEPAGRESQDGSPQDGSPQDGSPQDGSPQDGSPQDSSSQSLAEPPAEAAATRIFPSDPPELPLPDLPPPPPPLEELAHPVAGILGETTAVDVRAEVPRNVPGASRSRGPASPSSKAESAAAKASDGSRASGGSIDSGSIDKGGETSSDADTLPRMPSPGSVTLPMDSVEAAKERYRQLQKRSLPGRPVSGPEDFPPLPETAEQVPSVTVPMSVVESAKRRYKAKMGEADPPPLPPGPLAPAESSPAPPHGTAPSPVEEPATTPPVEPVSSPSPLTLSELGFGAADAASSDPSSAAEPGPASGDLGPEDFAHPGVDRPDLAGQGAGRRTGRRRPDRLGVGRRGDPPSAATGFAARLFGILGVLLVVVAVFAVAYVFSGRNLPTFLGGSADSSSSTAGLENGSSVGSATGANGDNPAVDVASVAVRAAPDAKPGTVILDSSPWGQIESITDTLGEPVPIAGARATPKRFDLPPGTYTVVLAHPPSGRSRTEIFQVSGGETTEVRVSFPMNVEEFVDAAGW